MDKFKYWIILFFLAQSSYALTICNVELSTDNNPGDRGLPGELRYCLNSMNESLNSRPDDYQITFAFPMTIQLNGILPIINNSSNPVSITIGNSGSLPTVTLDGNGTYSGFFTPMGNVTIQNMIFQNLTAKGGNGGNGISGGGGGLGAGGAIYVPQNFLPGSLPSVTLMNVLINSCSAVGGNGGSFSPSSLTGYEGGGGGGGLSGNGGSVTAIGITGGAGGGGFGGDGGDVTLSSSDPLGGGGGGGGGWGSRATLSNQGNGGSDQQPGWNGNGYGLSFAAGSGGGGLAGGIYAGGGGGGAGTVSGGGGGGSDGSAGLPPKGSIPPLQTPTQGTIKQREGKSVYEVLHELSVRASKSMQGKIRTYKSDSQGTAVTVNAPMDTVGSSGGYGGHGAGGGGGAVVVTTTLNDVDGSSGSGGYGGGGGGAAGAGASDTDYTVQGGLGGIGGGGGGGGVNVSGTTPATGGNSSGGGGGGGGGPSNGLSALGGVDTGNLGGGAGGFGANSAGTGGGSGGGGGGGGGSGLGGAIFVDSGLNFTVQALSGIPTVFNTSNNTTQAGSHGSGGPGGSDGFDGSALGNSIFLRTNSSLTFVAQGVNDLLTLGDQVAFTDDTDFGAGGTVVFIRGDGTVIYNGSTDYRGAITINNTNFKVNGLIDQASIFVCRQDVNSKRGILSGIGSLTGDVFVNSGTIYPDTGGTLTLGSLILNSAGGSALGSLVHTDINSSGASSVTVTGPASLAGILEINIDSTAQPGRYTLLTSSGITGTFDSVTFTGRTPSYTLSYLPVGSPTFVQLDILGFVEIPATVNGSPILNPAVVCCGRPIILGDLPVPGPGPTVYSVTQRTGSVTCELGQTQTQQYLKMQGKNGSCTIVGTKNGVVSNPLTVVAS